MFDAERAVRRLAFPFKPRRTIGTGAEDERAAPASYPAQALERLHPHIGAGEAHVETPAAAIVFDHEIAAIELELRSTAVGRLILCRREAGSIGVVADGQRLT